MTRQDWEPGWQVPYLVFPLAWMRCPACVTTREAVPRGLGPHRAERVWLPKQPHLGRMRPWRRGDTQRWVPKPGAVPSGCSGRWGLGPAALSLFAASPAAPQLPPQSESLPKPGVLASSLLSGPHRVLSPTPLTLAFAPLSAAGPALVCAVAPCSLLT